MSQPLTILEIIKSAFIGRRVKLTNVSEVIATRWTRGGSTPEALTQNEYIVVIDGLRFDTDPEDNRLMDFDCHLPDGSEVVIMNCRIEGDGAVGIEFLSDVGEVRE